MKKLFYLLCGLVVIMTGCVSTQRTQALRIAIEKPISTLNYQKTSATADMEQMGQFMEGLLVFDGQGAVAPAGAKSWQVSQDGLVYRFALRQDAKWQDGSPVIAQDYYFAWLQIVAHKTSPFAYTLFPIKNAKQIYQGKAGSDTFGVKVLGDFSLEITLEKPYLSFIYSLATPTMYPLKQSFYEKVGQEVFGTTKETILTNGAYDISEYEAISQLLLNKSMTYWNSSETAVPTVEVSVVPEEAARRALFDEGNLDIMSVGANSRERYQKQGIQIVSQKTAKINYLYLSGQTLQENELLKNKKLRQAIAYAIDRQVLTDSILKDGSVPLSRIVPCGFAYVGKTDYCDFSAGNTTYTFDVKKAQQYLEQAKAELDRIQLPISIVYQEVENNVLVLENLKFQLEKNLPGLVVSLIGLPVVGYSAVLRKDGIASAVQSWSGSFANPEVYLQILEGNSNFNFAHFQDVAFDEQYQLAMRASDKKQQFATYATAENIALDAYMFIPLYQQGITYILSNRVTHFNYKLTLPNVYYKDIKLA